ncbi:hypothetical protein [Helicobacter sp. MIT 01-3238]|uniref:hypothetical protein n=1 Tax=Helicobacter sp. MIT 01-3238 TaxID=398627 RepID=UPI002162D6CE|nr:hypothetical protein [Helicobacter sp. MIT 01-3238]
MYERKRDTLPNPGHDLAVHFFWLNPPPKNKIVAEGARGWVIVNLDSRFKHKRELVKLKNSIKNGCGILEIKSWLCEASNEIEQTSSSRKRAQALHDFSPKDKPTRKELQMNKIVIFGAGNCGRLIAQNLLTQGEQILCFIDNDPLKANGTITLNGGGGVIH